jgi:hypothetical protein
VNGGDHGRLLQAGNHAIIIDRPRGCDAHVLAIQTSFAKKMTGSYDGNHRLLALLGNDGQLDLALLKVEDRVRRVSLGENDLILRYDDTVFPSPTLARNFLGSNEALIFFLMEASLFLARKGLPVPPTRPGEAERS